MPTEEPITLYFPKGIPGFEEYTHFAMSFEEDAPLAHLTVVDDLDCGFLLLQPQSHFQGYLPQVDLDAETVDLLGLKEGEHVETWVIVTLASDLAESTANLRAPLLINFRTQTGVQMIIDDDAYPARQPLFTIAEPGEGKV